ncbi:MAG: response regulator [Proteobacteria bacterium]|nr:response regulator [Pseudomonadota bacterium]
MLRSWWVCGGIPRWSAAPVVADARQPLDGASIVVVDDDPQIRRILGRILTRAGARVHEADGAQAIALVTTEHVDLLLTDMDMPGLDGSAVAQEIVALQPCIGTVYMSGRSRDHHVEVGHIAPDDRWIAKPFTVETVVETIATALSR